MLFSDLSAELAIRFFGKSEFQSRLFLENYQKYFNFEQLAITHSTHHVKASVLMSNTVMILIP